MRTAVLIDGAFFIKRIRSMEPHNHFNAQRIADLATRYAILHLSHKMNGKRHTDELYRIFFYDCVPFEKKMHNPITGRAIDFAKTDEAKFRYELHNCLKRKRKVALRLGKLSDNVSWTISPKIMKSYLASVAAGNPITLTENDVMLDIKQKGVDMRIGLDISSITLKKQADKIILFSGDSDFVPAAKLARREGIDFILDPMWNNIPSDLFEHIDGLRSMCPNPSARKKSIPDK